MVAWHGVKEVDAPTSHRDGRAAASDNIHHYLRFSTPSKLQEHQNRERRFQDQIAENKRMAASLMPSGGEHREINKCGQ
jgi:hypothetical protein